MVHSDIIQAAAASSQHSTSSSPSPCSQQASITQRRFPSRTSQQHSSWNPLPRYFTTRSSLEQPQNAPESAPSNPAPSSSGDMDFTPANSQIGLFKNFYRAAMGHYTPEGLKAYWADSDARYSEIDCKRCEQQRDYLLSYSPIIRYMNDNIKRLGGNLDSTNIRCRTCKPGENMYGGFDHQFGIKLCANYIEKQSMLEDVLAHEMVHAYDHLRFKTDLGPEEDLRKVACSEIRASNLSGECRWANEFFRNWVLSFTSHHQDCVRRRAVISVKNRPNCESDLQAVKVVDEVWDSCFRDTRPFDEIFR